MSSQVSEISPVEVEVTVEVPWATVLEGLNKQYKTLARTAKVRGFRPGKVPVNMVKKLFKRQVEAEVASDLIQNGLMEAVNEHEIAMVAQPQVKELPDITQGEDFTFKATIEVRPTLGELKLDGVSVFRDLDAVEDSEVDAEIERLREREGDQVEPDPARPAKDGDILTIDYKVEMDGEDKPEMGAEGRNVRVGDEDLLNGFSAGLTGMSVEETKDIEVTFDEENAREDLKGKTAKFTVTLQAIRELVLPDLDDEFAKDVGDYESLDDLKAKIRSDFEERAKNRSELSIKDQIVDALLEQNDVPVPPSMLQGQKQQMFQEIVQLMQMAGPGAQSMVSGMLEGIDERAERRVKAGILMGTVAKQASLEVTEDEIEAKFAEIAEQTGKHIAKVRVDYSGDRRDMLENEMLEQKITAHLRDLAELKDGKPPKKDPPNSDGGDEG